jgi:hypothetical protein
MHIKKFIIILLNKYNSNINSKNSNDIITSLFYKSDLENKLINILSDLGKINIIDLNTTKN